MAHIFLALGSNVGNSYRNIEEAVKLLSKHLSNVKRAPLYSSKPMYVLDQPDFLNTVIEADTNLSPMDLFSLGKSVEGQVGRIQRYRNGPREIDIDILLYDDLVQDSSTLTIPHPRMLERDFVLKPLSDLNPLLVIPGQRKVIKELLDSLDTSTLKLYTEKRH